MLRALAINAPGESADKIENCTFDEISVGDSANLTRTLTRDGIALFAVFDCRSVNQRGEEVISGSAVTLATEKVRRPQVELPEMQLRRHDRYQELSDRCAELAVWWARLASPATCASSRTAATRAPRKRSSSLCSVSVPRDLEWVSHDGVRSISVLVTNGKQRRCFPCVAIYEPASKL